MDIVITSKQQRERNVYWIFIPGFRDHVASYNITDGLLTVDMNRVPPTLLLQFSEKTVPGIVAHYAKWVEKTHPAQ